MPPAAPISVFVARKIVTMNPSHPEATHVAVRHGRILGVGSLDELARWGEYRLDDSLADKVLLPGLVEGHSHAVEGGMWRYCHVGFHDRRGPDGKLWPGLQSIEEVVGRLREAEAGLGVPDQPLFAWGLDPIFFGGRRMSRADLDQVSTTRPVIVVHASGHLMNVNSVILERARIDRSSNIHGVLKDDAGDPTGELLEFAAMFMAYRVVGDEYLMTRTSAEGYRAFGRLANLAGVTTATDLFNDLKPESVEHLRQVTAAADFPLRLLPAFNASSAKPEDGIAKMAGLVPTSTDKLRFGLVKLMTDGSIQGFTARLRWPGYFNGRPNGIWNMAPEEIRRYVDAYHRAGYQLHIHTNGDEASEVTLDAIEAAMVAQPRPDHRHTLQHCQMADAAQFRRMASLGVCVNLFANHLFYWGDAHYSQTMGPDRAERMDACATALREGVTLAMHSDAPVTPIGPLFTAWCAVNRLTSSGRLLGAHERIAVADALQAITLGAARTLKLDHEIGSIEVGKRADFCVLEDDPTAVDPAGLKDVRVWGTVLGGRPFPASGG
ncbi:amidohydrolase [Desertibaculum subflavum]|uniref:amidohydrolase n=1 Tax=Desertibaculum subflavum TaxID=2268458 RepID=UPI000E660960